MSWRMEASFRGHRCDTISQMMMVIGCLVVLVGVVIGWWTVSGSGINQRTYRDRNAGGDGRHEGDSPLDSPWTMNEWSRGTQSRARRRR